MAKVSAICTLICLTNFGVAHAQSIERNPLDFTTLQSDKPELRADLDGDGQTDRALLAVDERARKVGLWVLNADQNRSMLLDLREATQITRKATLSILHSGDPSCPTTDARGRRECNRSWGMSRYPSLIVSYPNGAQVAWGWNGRNYTREEVFP